MRGRSHEGGVEVLTNLFSFIGWIGRVCCIPVWRGEGRCVVCVWWEEGREERCVCVW